MVIIVTAVVVSLIDIPVSDGVIVRKFLMLFSTISGGVSMVPIMARTKVAPSSLMEVRSGVKDNTNHVLLAPEDVGHGVSMSFGEPARGERDDMVGVFSDVKSSPGSIPSWASPETVNFVINFPTIVTST